ncbi:Bug family tripartite tricarboxylate transporter substrate binding protein [Hirschia baltica]|uniref:Uncharacterized protein n=1 Tax=Hirschia baltica (strain ATCC 49814 / DSM 5838 / IFAM 1418) TaxID=582402 RepID=C6XPK6_HIRBI|nr:hypothetical protein [Hirschia baltica]ACT60271.1 conserved hypothetical protein [Hirschia baltica ATCC 49814]
MRVDNQQNGSSETACNPQGNAVEAGHIVAHIENSSSHNQAISPRGVSLICAVFILIYLCVLMLLKINTPEVIDSDKVSAKEFFAGKTITAISPAGPSSTFTVLARLMEPYIEKYTGAFVTVQAVQAGGGYQARNLMFKSKPDGLTIVLVGHGPKMITGSMFKRAGVRYDWSKFVPLGKLTETSFVLYADANSKWERPDDLVSERFFFGESTPFFGPQFAAALGWENMVVIPGYTSSAGRATAVSRDEIQMTAGSVELYASQPDAVKPIVTALPLSQYPEVPTLAEASVEGRAKWADYIDDWMSVMYLVYAPPGIAEDRADFLEDALRRTWADPDFRHELERLQLKPTQEFISRKVIQKRFDRLSSLTPSEIEELREIIAQKYKVRG